MLYSHMLSLRSYSGPLVRQMTVPYVLHVTIGQPTWATIVNETARWTYSIDVYQTYLAALGEVRSFTGPCQYLGAACLPTFTMFYCSIPLVLNTCQHYASGDMRKTYVSAHSDDPSRGAAGPAPRGQSLRSPLTLNALHERVFNRLCVWLMAYYQTQARGLIDLDSPGFCSRRAGLLRRLALFSWSPRWERRTWRYEQGAWEVGLGTATPR